MLNLSYRLLVQAAISLLALGSLHAAGWKMQLYYDKDSSSLELHDLQCPSPLMCVAAGVIVDTLNARDKAKGTVVYTSDGGAHWNYEEIKEVPLSLFFLNAETGWMVTEKGIWQSVAAGREWKKLKSIKGLERLWFLDASHGFAIGAAEALYETNDGGQEWAKLTVSDLPAFPPDSISYDCISFSGSRGLIAGSIAPEYVNPRRGPAAALLLETNDSGRTWKARQVKIHGRVSNIRLLEQSALLLVQYSGKTKFPSELFSMDLNTRDTKPVFEQTDDIARDFVQLPGNEIVVAAVERLGELSEVPIPGKLHLLHSSSLDAWSIDHADYRAVAARPIIAAADANNVWVATDTGMILKRTQ